MGVKINGAIYRNVQGETEGIDTPSLLINGQPLSGGGTQLYKHTITINANYGDGDVAETLIFITKSATSLVGLDLYEITDFIAGFMLENSGTEDESLSSIIAKPVYSESIIYYSTYNNQITENSQWSSSILTDTVTTL